MGYFGVRLSELGHLARTDPAKFFELVRKIEDAAGEDITARQPDPPRVVQALLSRAAALKSIPY